MITYRSDVRPDAQTVAQLCRAASLNRPVHDLERMAHMYASSNLVWTAWDGDRLIGVLRGWSDGAYDGYVCDLAVHPNYQKQGVGKKLLDCCRATESKVQFVLRASEVARDYYSHIGWQKIENGWFWPRQA